MKLIDVLPFLTAVDALFKSFYDQLKVFNTYFLDPYHDNVFAPKVDAAKIVVPTDSKRALNKGYTDQRNNIMDELTAPLGDLRYKIKLCVKNGTITDSLASFQLAPFTRSITKKEIKLFHTAYESAILQITKADNKAALIAAGFTQPMIIDITKHHDNAWDIQNNKIDLKEEITDLSEANQIIINEALKEAQEIIDGLKGMAIASGNKDLQKRATKAAILKTVQPTPAKKPRNRKIKAASGLVIATNYAAKNLMQLTLLIGENVAVCRCEHKTDPYTVGLDLQLKQQWQGKKAEIPGSGKYIKLFNRDANHDAIVSILKIIVKNIREVKKS